MLKSMSRCGMLIICGSAMALAASVLPAQAATTGWRAVTTLAVKGKQTIVTSVDAVTAKDAWAVGAAATTALAKQVIYIEHWTGKSWKHVVLPSKVAKVANDGAFISSVVAASSDHNVWVFGESQSGSGTIIYLRFNGRTWTTGKIPGTSLFVLLTAAEALGKSSAWVFGGQQTSNGKAVPFAAEFNGHRWTTKSVPGSGEIAGASAVSVNNIWAVTGPIGVNLGTGTSAVLHWNGTSWKAAASQPKKLPAGSALSAITAAGSTVWIAGSAGKSSGATTVQFVDKLTGSKWAAAPTDLKDSASGNSCAPDSAVPDGHGGLWTLELCLFSNTSELWHLTAGKSSAPTSPKFGGSTADLWQLSAVPGQASVWAVGDVEVGKATDGLIGVDGPTPG